MPRNVEIKARIEGLESVMARVDAIADSGPVEVDQDDTFFRCEAGRLKLRTFSRTAGELIYYRRADQEGPKESFYILSPTTTPGTLRESLSMAYGVAGRVRKHRTVFIVGRTRVHLDRVDDLGDFLELEVVLEDGEPTEAGVREAHALMARLGVQPSQLVEGAYVDFLARDGARTAHARFPVAVHVFVLRGDAVLLLRRCNTGDEDGKLGVVAGHVEPGESVTGAAVREAQEAVGLALALDRLRVVGIMHRQADEARVEVFLSYALDGTGLEPENREPGRCSELTWATVARLPDDTIPYVRAAIENFARGTWFQEFGWEPPGADA